MKKNRDYKINVLIAQTNVILKFLLSQIPLLNFKLSCQTAFKDQNNHKKHKNLSKKYNNFFLFCVYSEIIMKLNWVS